MLSTLLEFVQVLFFGALGIGLSVGGAYVERFALASFQTGDTVLAAWGTVLGVLLLLFAFLITRDNLAPTIRAVRNRRAD